MLVGDGRVVYANQRWAELTGVPAARWSGQDWLGVVVPGERLAVRSAIESTLARGCTYEADWEVRRPGGEPRILHVVAIGEQRDGRSPRVLLVADDVTEERRRTAQLAHLATHDPLTGLRNRRQFLEFVEHAAAGLRRSPHGAAAVLFVDVDDLKDVNDRCGHDAGDQMLVKLAARITAAIRPGDVAARYGGDEFVVLCDGLRDADEARLVAERIRTAARSVRAGGRRCSVSIGLAEVTPGVPAEQILRSADEAMYCAKRARLERRPAGHASGRRATPGVA